MVQKIQITLSQAIDGFILEKRAQQLRPHTLASYQNALQRLQAHLPGDPLLDDITPRHVATLLTDLGQRPIAPAGIAPRPAKPLTKKSILNIHSAFSSFWTWATKEALAEVHIIKTIPRPRPERRAIVPLTKPDVQALLTTCDSTRAYSRPGKRRCTNTRPTALRDRAIILLLLDTGLRVTELCDLNLAHLDLSNQRCKVLGKGSKERIVRVGRRTIKTLWRYLATRPAARPRDPLFVKNTTANQRLTRRAVYLILRRLGDRAGISPTVHPHRFRHTFAITFLRNGGDVFSLQAMLGHSSLDMVHRYLALAQTDTENAHRRASPVDNWHL